MTTGSIGGSRPGPKDHGGVSPKVGKFSEQDWGISGERQQMADRDLGEGTRLAALTGAWICFEDEAGQSLRPGRARTWAPRGHTPVARVSWPGATAGG